MKTFTASLKNEWKKITARRKFWVFLIIEVLICLGAWGVNGMLSKISGGVITSAVILGNLPLSMLSFFVQIYIPLLVLMTACDLFAGEAHDGTLRASFMRPISRFKLYMSKAAAVFCMAAVYMGVLFILTSAMKLVGVGSLDGVGESIMAYILDMIPLIVLILFVAMLNQFSSSPSLTMVLCIILYVGLYIVGILLPQFSGLMFTGYSQWHNLWLGVVLPLRSMLAKIGLLLGYSLVFGCVGYYLFERKEA